MSGRIVLFGATGYTGELTARALVQRGTRPVLAGRDAARLSALGSELGELETRVADVAAPATLDGLVERGDVLISTVGPFARLGEPAVRAAIAAGAHYLDSTGESAFIRAVFERHGPAAQAAGSGLLTAFGYDWVPGNLAGALALRAASDAATRVDVGYYVTGAGAGAMSGGTRASAVGILLEPAFALRSGRLVAEPTARRARAFELDGRRAEGVSVGGSEHFALPRVAPGLRDVGVYVGVPPGLAPAVQLLSGTAALLGRVMPGGREALGALLRPLAPGSTGGPDAQARAGVGSLVVAEAFDAAGARLSAVRLAGANPYEFTAAILAWGARAAAEGALRATGALGPVDGFGLEALERGCAEAGIARAA